MLRRVEGEMEKERARECVRERWREGVLSNAAFFQDAMEFRDLPSFPPFNQFPLLTGRRQGSATSLSLFSCVRVQGRVGRSMSARKERAPRCTAGSQDMGPE